MKTSRLAVTANSCGLPHARVFIKPESVGIRRFIPTRTAGKILAVLIGICAMDAPVKASSVNLAWNANPEENVVGYRLSYGTSPGVHPITQEAGNVTSTTVTGLVEGQTYYFVLRAVDSEGLLSVPSDEISYQVPVPDYVNPDGWKLHYVSSHEPPVYGATKAFDGNPATFWHTFYSLGGTPPPHEIQIDMGKEQVIAGFTYLTRQDRNENGRIADYEFYVSRDGIEWGAPVVSGTFPNSLQRQEVRFPDAAIARYIRLRQLSEVNGSNHCAVADISVIPPDSGQPENRAPVASSSSVETNQGSPVAVTLVASDPDGDPLTYQIVTQPGKGSLSGNAPNLTYTPHAGASGPDHFTFRASDGQLASNTATVSITINSANSAPLAANQSVTAVAGSPVAIMLTATDPDGDTLVYQITSQPGKGTLSGTAPNLTYTPHAEVSGSDSFTFRASDGQLASNTATVSITINPANSAPVAANQSVTAVAGSPVAITLTATDADGDTLTYQVTRQPGKGTLSGTPPRLTYTPHAEASGSDSFTFRASDGKEVSNTATVSITIEERESSPELISRTGWRLHFVSSEEAPTYAATRAFDGNTNTFWHSAWINGTMPPPHELQIDLGQVEHVAGFRYLPRQDAYNNGNIADYEFYVSMDGSNWGNPVAKGTFPNTKTRQEALFPSVAARYIRLRQLTEVHGWEICAVADISLLRGDSAAILPPENQAPVASSSSIQTDEDTPVSITLVAHDPDGDPLSYEIVTQPAMGVLGGTAPNLTYTPHQDVNGSDSFTFRVSDGEFTSETAMVSITIHPVNDAPVAQNQSVTTAEDTPVGIMLYATDVDGDPLTYRIVAAPVNGSLSGNAPNLVYTPKPYFHGTDTFTFVANDGTVDSNIASVSITVSSVNHPPVAIARMISTPADTPVAITLTATDRNGDDLSFRITRPPMKGRLSGTPPTLTYTPNPRVSGSDSFTFVANDGMEDSNTATIFINLTEPLQKNRPPVFKRDKLSRSRGIAGEAYSCLSLEGTAIDPDGDPVVYEKAEGPQWLTISHSGEIGGTPPADAAGPNVFVIRARDPEGAYALATLEIDIEGSDLPLPWTMNRFGVAGEESTAHGDHDSLTLSGLGALAGQSDSGVYVWQTLTGDGSITARIDSIADARPTSRIGLIVRESLSADSKHAFIGVDSRGFVRWARRTSTGGNTSISTVASVRVEGTWLRLTRDGNSFSAFTSMNGSDWTRVATASIAIESPSYIGLWVSSGGDRLSTATFNNVTVTP